MTITVKFKKFSELARAPKYAKPKDSGADLFIANLGELNGPLYPGHTAVVYADIALELPDGYEAQVRPRSSSGKRGLLVHWGTVDNQFRGSVGICVTNIGMGPQILLVGEKIAQLVFARVEQADFEEVDELNETERGAGGFGSTDRPAGNSG